MKISCILFLILIFCLVQIIESRKRLKYTCHCKNTSIDSIEEFGKKKDDIVDFLWSCGLEDWSPLAGFFKEDLRSLLFSDSDESNKFAELNILLMSTFNPYLKRHPSGCAQASVINATISCIEDGNNTAISNEVNTGIIDSFYAFATNYAYCSGIKALGCGCSKNDKILCSFDPSWKCEGNGFVYDIEKIWNLKGKNIPERVRNIVKVLYQSYDFKDKYIALMATYSLLDLPNRINQEFNPLTFFEFLYLQYGPEYKKCCCKERRIRLAYLKDTITTERKAAFSKLGKYYSSPESCRNGTC